MAVYYGYGQNIDAGVLGYNPDTGKTEIVKPPTYSTTPGAPVPWYLRGMPVASEDINWGFGVPTVGSSVVDVPTSYPDPFLFDAPPIQRPFTPGGPTLSPGGGGTSSTPTNTPTASPVAPGGSTTGNSPSPVPVPGVTAPGTGSGAGTGTGTTAPTPTSRLIDLLGSLFQPQSAGGGAPTLAPYVYSPMSDAAAAADAGTSGRNKIILVVLVLAVIGGIWYYRKHHKKKKAPSPAT